MVEGDTRLPQLSSDFHMHSVAQAQNKQMKENLIEGVLKEWQRRVLVALTRDLGSVSSTPMVAHTCLLNRALASMDTAVTHTRMHAKHARIIKMLKEKGKFQQAHCL